MSHLEQTIQRLLGCGWGRAVSSPGDDAACPERAVQIVVLHDGDSEAEVRLCHRHLAMVLQETTPRRKVQP